jgi:hypothetical protein
MTRAQTLLLGFIFVAAAVIRLVSLAPVPFFCDVPYSLRVIASGTMVIQFPGYAPFHWVVRLLGDLLGSFLHGAVLFSFLCGMGAMIYCTLFAWDRGGFRGALLAAALMGFSPIAVYFSCVGASYTTDLLGMSALLYHGNRLLATRQERHYVGVVLWFIVGCLMRTSSFPFVGFGVVFLLWKFYSRRNIVFTLAAGAVGAVLFWAPTLYYFDRQGTFRASLNSPAQAAFHGFGVVWLAENEVRNVLFLLWSLNIFVVVILLVLWQARRNLHQGLTAYVVLLTAPYFCFLLWYDCHAGYVCLLLPAFACAPWLAEKQTWLNRRAYLLAGLFTVISLLQFFVPRPMAFTDMKSLVLNTYVLTYTRAGIEMGLFDNLQAFAKRNHLRAL